MSDSFRSAFLPRKKQDKAACYLECPGTKKCPLKVAISDGHVPSNCRIVLKEHILLLILSVVIGLCGALFIVEYFYLK